MKHFCMIPLHSIKNGKCTCGNPACNSPGKHPRINWDKYKTERPSEADLARWKKQFNGYNWGIVTGAVSGVIVLDVDGEAGAASIAGKELPETWAVQTGKGYHYYFLHPGFPVENGVRILPGLDIRGDGGYVVAPGSMHVSGKRYEWVPLLSPEDFPEPAPVPEWLLKILKNKQSSGEKKEKINPVNVLNGVPEGKRDDTIFRFACQKRSQGLTYEETRTLILEVAKNCQPPFPEDVAIKKVEQAFKYPSPDVEIPAGNKTIQFPPNAYTGLAGRFAEVFSEYTEVPKATYYMCFLTFLGLLFSGKISLKSQLDIQPRLYLAILGRSGLDKKSEGIKQTHRFFNSLSRGTTIFSYPAMEGMGSVEGAGDQWQKEEAEAGICRSLLIFDELRTFVNKAKQNGSLILPMTTTLFEKNSYINITRTHKPVDLKNLHLAMASACTFETYETMWEPQFLNIGFLNRLFLVADSSDKERSRPKEIPPDILNPLKTETFDLIQRVSQMPGAIRLDLSPSADELWEDWYHRRPRDLHSIRLDTIGLRLMPLLAANTGEFSLVPVEIVEKVIEMVDYQHQVRKLYDPVDADTKMAIMEEKIRRVLMVRGRLRKWELQQYTNANKLGLWFFKAALENLLKNQEIFYDKKAKMFQLVLR